MEILKKKPIPEKGEVTDKGSIIKNMLGVSIADIKTGITSGNRETLKEIRSQNERLMRQEELLKNQKEKIENLENLLLNRKECSNGEEDFLKEQKEIIEEQLLQFERQATKIEMQMTQLDILLSKQESVLSNFPKLEENITKRINNNIEKLHIDVSEELSGLESIGEKNSFRLNLYAILILVFQILGSVGILYFIINK